MNPTKKPQFSLVQSLVADLPVPEDTTVVEYVWIDGIGTMRSKTKVLRQKVTKVEELEEWNYDGSSTHQAETTASEVILKPIALFKDPFRAPAGMIALCETYTPEGEPALGNFRATCKKIMDDANDSKPWFGIEQEYVILVPTGTTIKTVLGWPTGGFPKPQGPYYCSVGTPNSFGRELAEMHMRACLYAGVKLAGVNGEVLPGQWEFQIGICEGIEVGDHLWMARYILQRCSEFFGWEVTFAPKPVPGSWNGSGGHTNFSTLKMRTPGEGKTEVANVIRCLGLKHYEHMLVYGEDNHLRLSGKCETSKMDKFSHGVADRTASIRIPSLTEKNGYGYIEDRRPAANLEPYLVAGSIVDTACLAFKYGKIVRQEFAEYKEKLAKLSGH